MAKARISTAGQRVSLCAFATHARYKFYFAIGAVVVLAADLGHLPPCRSGVLVLCRELLSLVAVPAW